MRIALPDRAQRPVHRLLHHVATRRSRLPRSAEGMLSNCASVSAVFRPSRRAPPSAKIRRAGRIPGRARAHCAALRKRPRSVPEQILAGLVAHVPGIEIARPAIHLAPRSRAPVRRQSSPGSAPRGCPIPKAPPPVRGSPGLAGQSAQDLYRDGTPSVPLRVDAVPRHARHIGRVSVRSQEFQHGVAFLKINSNTPRSPGTVPWPAPWGRFCRAAMSRSGDVAFAGFDQRTHHVAHHVLQKSAAANAIDQRTVPFRHSSEENTVRTLDLPSASRSSAAANAVKSCSP